MFQETFVSFTHVYVASVLGGPVKCILYSWLPLMKSLKAPALRAISLLKISVDEIVKSVVLYGQMIRNLEHFVWHLWKILGARNQGVVQKSKNFAVLRVLTFCIFNRLTSPSTDVQKNHLNAECLVRLQIGRPVVVPNPVLCFRTEFGCKS